MFTSPLVGLAVALVFAIIELHATTGPEWRCGGPWLTSLLALDCLVALASSRLALFTTTTLGAQSAPEWLVIVGASAVGPRILYLVPIPASKAAAARFIAVRRYFLIRVGERSRAGAIGFRIDQLQPAAESLPLDDLGAIVVAMLEECQRAGTFPRDRAPRELVDEITSDPVPRSVRVESLVELIIQYGGRPMANEILRRAHLMRTTP